MVNTGNYHIADRDDGSHLYFEVLEKGQNVDPDKYLNLCKVKHEEGDVNYKDDCPWIEIENVGISPSVSAAIKLKF